MTMLSAPDESTHIFDRVGFDAELDEYLARVNGQHSESRDEEGVILEPKYIIIGPRIPIDPMVARKVNDFVMDYEADMNDHRDEEGNEPAEKIEFVSVDVPALPYFIGGLLQDVWLTTTWADILSEGLDENAERLALGELLDKAISKTRFILDDNTKDHYTMGEAKANSNLYFEAALKIITEEVRENAV